MVQMFGWFRAEERNRALAARKRHARCAGNLANILAFRLNFGFGLRRFSLD